MEWLRRILLIALLGQLNAHFPLASSACAATPGVQTAAPDSAAVPLELINRFTTNGTSSYAIDHAGRLWAWGRNTSGELGNGSTVDSSTPVLVQFPADLGHTPISRVAVNENGSVYALDSAGHLWAWGDNEHGQLGAGDGDLRNRSVPTRVRFPAGLGDVSIISMATTHGDHTQGWSVGSVYAVDNLGRLWAWGENASGQIGDGSQTDRETPVRVQFPAALGRASIVSVAVGDDNYSYISVYALDSLGRLWVWGDNEVGQLGNGSESLDPLLLPKRVRFPRKAGKVSIARIATGSIGNGYFFALDRTGRLWACGSNGNGALGDGSTTLRSTPVRVRFPTHWWQRSVSIVRVIGTHNSYGASYAIDDAGHLWSWGGNQYGSLGQETSAARLIPQRVQFPSALDGASIVNVKADGYAAYAIDSAGRLWDWGNNRYGQLGNGTLANRFNSPALVRFPGAPEFASIVSMSAQSPKGTSAFGYAVDNAGGLWAWGYHKQGQLGDGSDAIVASPVRIRFQAGAPQQARVPPPVNGQAASVCSTAKPQFVYVADQEGISAYRIDSASGALTEIPGSPFPDPGRPNFIAVNPSGTVAYVTNNSNTVSAYRVDAATGALTEVPASPFKAGNQPYRLRFNPSGTVAYVANWMSNTFTAYRIDPATGALARAGDDSPPVEDLANHLPDPRATVSPSAPFAYLLANDGILVYRIDPEHGSNHEIPSAKVDSPSARAITLNPAGTLAYVAESPPWVLGSVSAYRVDANTGALTPVPGNPVAKGFLSPDPVAIDCTGTFAYVTAKGNGASKSMIWAYRIDAASGALTAVAGSPFATGILSQFVAVVQP